MNTFPSYDYTICRVDDCPNKGACVRYLTYQKAMKEEYPHMTSVKVKNEGECELYVKAK